MTKEERVLQLSQQLSGQWAVPILLELDPRGGRFTPLQHKLRISPGRLSDNLKRLNEAGIVMQLSPHERRHPLLPEYVLSEKGRLYLEAAKAIRAAEADIGHGRLSAKAWNIPVLLSLDYEHVRFQEIRSSLQTITPRILSARLQELGEEGLIGRQITEQPRPSYVYLLSKQAKMPVHGLAVDLASIV